MTTPTTALRALALAASMLLSLLLAHTAAANNGVPLRLPTLPTGSAEQACQDYSSGDGRTCEYPADLIGLVTVAGDCEQTCSTCAPACRSDRFKLLGSDYISYGCSSTLLGQLPIGLSRGCALLLGLLAVAFAHRRNWRKPRQRSDG